MTSAPVFTTTAHFRRRRIDLIVAGALHADVSAAPSSVFQNVHRLSINLYSLIHVQGPRPAITILLCGVLCLKILD